MDEKKVDLSSPYFETHEPKNVAVLAVGPWANFFITWRTCAPHLFPPPQSHQRRRSNTRRRRPSTSPIWSRPLLTVAESSVEGAEHRAMGPSQQCRGAFDIEALAPAIAVDHNIRLPNYFRIADSLLTQVRRLR
ncbi:hypothetical protein HU200_055555 [Digitaria exilis]|uniref:Uncharacterized protein n=1 Tax=Digitaria exilis TaxID=1010633 RepID=A0A835AI93_9POAL|nr:hypothetical protein HU200_055555 [Digitaria exilis]